MSWLSEIIVGLLALIGTLGGSYFANRRASALMLYRLEQLEHKVEGMDRSQELARIRERLTALEARVK